ncbi:MAG: SDR family NAD(P)-dependent oxidoreductase [Nitrospira sp.]|nr:SDR family NAD(P)-dependent oxidoreductase [Nitrospira sp.]
MSYLIIGASAGLGRSLAYRLAAAGHDLGLVSSDGRDLEAISTDLGARYGVQVVSIAAQVGGEDGYLDELTAVNQRLGGVKGVLFPIGFIFDNDDGTLDPSRAAFVMKTNCLAVMSIVARLLPKLKEKPRAVIVGFGSIAGSRGRGVNVVYAAAKRALASFFESLRIICEGSTVHVQFYVVGFLNTGLSFGRYTPLRKADPDRFAEVVVRNLEHNVNTAYYPFYWRFLCYTLTLLPWNVYKRLKTTGPLA